MMNPEERITIMDLSILEQELMLNVEARMRHPDDVKQIGRAIAAKLEPARCFLRALEWLERGKK